MARYKLSNKKICGEAEKVDVAYVTKWIESKKDEIEKYHPNDIFNCDETGIFFRCLPSTIVLKGTKCHDGSNSKERITALVC